MYRMCTACTVHEQTVISRFKRARLQRTRDQSREVVRCGTEAPLCGRGREATRRNQAARREFRPAQCVRQLCMTPQAPEPSA